MAPGQHTQVYTFIYLKAGKDHANHIATNECTHVQKRKILRPLHFLLLQSIHTSVLSEHWKCHLCKAQVGAKHRLAKRAVCAASWSAKQASLSTQCEAPDSNSNSAKHHFSPRSTPVCSNPAGIGSLSQMGATQQEEVEVKS